MIINVNKNKITIDTGHTANKGEYNIRTCNFIFSEDYTDDLSKVAIFTKDGKSYKEYLVNNQCIIPYEVLQTKGTITIGVYAYSLTEEGGEEVLEQRFSPAPAQIFMDYGSYVEDAENASHPTPTEIEQLSARISAVEIDAQQVETNTQDIADIKENKADKSEIPDVSNFITKNVNDLTYYTLATNTGTSIVLTMNSSTYVMTLQLKNSDGTILSEQTVDLPLETMVVNGSYDDQTKKIILTLNNGNTIEFSVADLVSGLVSFTDYASSTIAGVLKTGVSLGTSTGTTGDLKAAVRTYSQYTNGSDNTFIGKGTLENVITGKGIVDATKIKTETNTTAGNVYDVTYINTMIGNLETILETLDVGSGV